jgi:hypothetical protein
MFCSNKCSAQYRSKNSDNPATLKKCKHCEKEFKAKKKTNIYCSNKCRQEYDKAHHISKNLKCCKQCNKEFKAKNHAIFCSNKCRSTYDKEHKKTNKNKIRICKHCGVEFQSKQHKATFCSKDCGYKHNKKHHNQVKNCEFCNKEFETTRETKKYCCHSCWSNHLGSKNPIKNRPYLKICSTCNNEFRGNKNSKYCSKKCAGEARRTKKITKCGQCDKEIRVKNKKKIQKFHFCSLDCYKKSVETIMEIRICIYCHQGFEVEKKVILKNYVLMNVEQNGMQYQKI